MIELRVLGPLEVLRHGEPVRIPADKERALLALLVIDAGVVLSADQLIDRLWGKDLPDNPANALQAVVSRLRRAIGADGVIVTEKPGYVLQVEPESIDASRFEDLLRRATRLGTDDPSRAADLLSEALSLWRGHAYADLAYEDLAQQECVRLEELRVGALEEKIAADLALGRNREALAELEQLVAAHPLRERLRAELMLALYRSGRQSDAVAAYHETRRVLSEELGLDPGPELENVYQLILRQDPSLRPTIEPGDNGSRTNLPIRVTSFVGREAEIREVTARNGLERETTALLDEAETIRFRYRRPRGALAERDVEELTISGTRPLAVQQGGEAQRSGRIATSRSARRRLSAEPKAFVRVAPHAHRETREPGLRGTKGGPGGCDIKDLSESATRRPKRREGGRDADG